ncbi:MAG: HPr(Ser) kinase/phosphatase [Lachnospiraceae bacterium]|nr:HPr(Ser) kinase/phosphatase [Lachnospiraceae bacterium]
MASISLKAIMEKLDLKLLTGAVDIDQIRVTQSDINRPALQMAGYFEHFDATRLQIIGSVEYSFMESLKEKDKELAYRRLLSFDIPGIVICRSLIPDPLFLRIAEEEQVPVLSTSMTTSAFASEVIRWLNVQLAPRIRIHGVLVDVYGVGLLITGESGIGKSEAALELVRRGHRLVSDDVVEIRKVSEATLVGSAPDITKHFIELRGIGIIDVKMLFGASCVRETQNIDIVIKLEEWDKDKDYDRMGLDEEYTEYLGNKIVIHRIPIRPGRNLAIILESAAVNYRQKQMGYNAAQELYRRVQESIAHRGEESDGEDLDHKV